MSTTNTLIAVALVALVGYTMVDVSEDGSVTIDDPTETSELEQAGEELGDAAEDAGDAVGDAVEEAGDTLEKAADEGATSTN